MTMRPRYPTRSPGATPSYQYGHKVHLYENIHTQRNVTCIGPTSCDEMMTGVQQYVVGEVVVMIGSSSRKLH